MKLKFLFITVLMVVLTACSNIAVDHSNMDHGEAERNDSVEEVAVEEQDGKKVFNIEVKEAHWMLNDELMFDAWTYNGSLPGQEIRVTEGDEVVLNVKNSLSVPTAIHLHGFPVPNEMDGVPGVTQNAIMPGEEFVYEYTADVPGTYWYHSHQNGAVQVDMGLYGVFIVEPKNQPEYDVDELIVIDEWSSMMEEMGMDHSDMDHGNMHHGGHGGHGGHDMHGGMDHQGMSHAEMMNMMYDTMVINGKATPAIAPIEVGEGDTTKLRFLNAGLFTQVVSIPGHSFKVTHYDGQEVNEPEWISETAFRIAPAERYEVEIKMDQPGAWGIEIFAEENPQNLQALVPIVYSGFKVAELETSTFSNYFDFTNYGSPKEISIGEITKEYDMLLGTEDSGETFTINGKQFPNHEVYEVEEGDVVKFTITNDTEVDHPMHLHGEFFYVLSKDGEPIKGSPIKKDTLNVRPNETYEIVFEAKNPGIWMFHCHEFHHANGGMVAEVIYKGFEPTFELDPDVPNQPE
ncbi:multicopper oxidase family protein [Alkalihalobacterium chitinilyticum]|uniref:Multicopper oxidase family protein n=1 Tax=Alkalihalobacterium chitinilyticum TaxID=2980103 RepID=A0ABT5VM73_9BACI|nr:multicopper oxidase family protein [Alkalihalobacterium chitinilyticum]MDE5416341.1 multicopper oxidase family protein [Alkalihalobacterium chitinilyticum]